MSCREGIDPADFTSGVDDGSTDPSQIQILDKTVVDSTDPSDQIPDAQGMIWANVLVGVTNINFASDITFNWATADGTAVSSGASPHLIAVVGAGATIPAGFSQAILTVPLNRKNSSGVNFTGKKAFTITISAAVNATILDAVATVTIDYDNIDPDAVNQVPISGLAIAAFVPVIVPEGDPITFGVFLRPASGGTVTVQYATANDTAVAPGDYTAKSGTLTFNPGDTQKNIVVQTVANAGIEGQERFFINLSSPSGATITTAQAYGLIDVDTGGGGTAQFTGWPDADRVTYDEFGSAGGGGCKYKTACTGFAGAACMSGLASFQGKGAWRFNPRRLFTDAGCFACIAGDGTCNYGSGCGGHSSGCSPNKVPNWLAGSAGHTVQRIDSHAYDAGTKSTKWSCTERTPSNLAEFGANTQAISATGSNDLITKIKAAIKANGVVYMTSKFYSNGGVGNNGWNSCRPADGNILRPFAGATSVGHAWCLFGWDDNVHVPSGADPQFGSLRGQDIGCFRIQSSHGCNWGDRGRGYIPYSVLQMPGTGGIWYYQKFIWTG